MRERIVAIGGGGHCRVLLDILLNHFAHRFELAGFVDPDVSLRQMLGISRLGDDAILPRLLQEGIAGSFIGVGGVANNSLHQRLYHRAAELGFRMINVIHPQAIVSTFAQLGNGVQVFPGAIINAGVTLGNNVIINTGAIVEHDCRVGDHVHIAPVACLGGGVVVEESAFVGMGARVIQQRRVGRDAVVGAGAVVLRDVRAGETVVGVPARAI